MCHQLLVRKVIFTNTCLLAAPLIVHSPTAPDRSYNVQSWRQGGPSDSWEL